MTNKTKTTIETVEIRTEDITVTYTWDGESDHVHVVYDTDFLGAEGSIDAPEDGNFLTAALADYDEVMKVMDR